MMEKYFKLIEKTDLFKGLSEEEIKVALHNIDARVISFQKGETVFAEGEKVTEAGIVLSGEVQIRKEDYRGNTNIIASLPQGQVFGEALCSTDTEIIPLGIYASEPSVVMLFKLKNILNTDTVDAVSFQLLKNILAIIAEKALSLRSKINIISRRTTREKLMAYLLSEARKAGKREFIIPFDRQGLADFLGVERSAMSAEISKLCNDGIIYSNKSYFKILKEH